MSKVAGESSGTEAVIVARLTSDERGAAKLACERAGCRALIVETPALAKTLLDRGDPLPRAVFVDPHAEDAAGLLSWLRADPKTMGVPVIALASHPSEGAYVSAHRLGVDDVALRSSMVTLTSRLAALDEGARTVPVKPWRGVAVVHHPDLERRRLTGRSVRQAGFELSFAADDGELSSAAKAGAKVVVMDLGEADDVAIADGLRDEVGLPDLPIVLLSRDWQGDHAAYTSGSTGVAAANAATDNLLFVLNEVLASMAVDARSSKRLLFSTLCAFRRAHELTPSYGLTYNVSRDGLYVRTLDPPKRDTDLWLELRPPGTTTMVHLRARVVWVRRPDAERGGTAPVGFGVRILNEQCPPPDLERYRVAYHAFREEPRPYRIDEPDAPVSEATPVAEDGDRKKGAVLLVDDDPVILRAYQRALGEQGYSLLSANDGARAVELFEESRPDAVITDLQMPRVGGIELLRRIRAIDEDVPVVIVTGAPGTETAIDAIEMNAFRYLTKPLDRERLLSTAERAVQVGRMARLRRAAVAMGTESAGGIVDAELSKSFDRALERICMHYQPIIQASTGGVYGYEALVRSTESSLPHPGALFGAAEKLGRLQELGRAIRNAAPDPLRERPERLFVNLHPQDLLDDDLLSGSSILAGVAAQVTLEITERASLTQIPDLDSRIAQLRELGFQIAIDDIGAGYAGLTSFAQLEPDVAKLDMTLIRDIHRRPTRARLVRSFVELCADLGIALICEGVETAEERDTLLALGCDLLQGYFFGKPSPILAIT